MKNLFSLIAVMITCLMCPPVYAEESEERVDFMELVRNIKGQHVIRIDTGELFDIDFSRREGTIGGYHYLFGPVLDPIKVRMYGSKGGALELLSNGMFIRVKYIETQGYRIATELEQVQHSAEIDT